MSTLITISCSWHNRTWLYEKMAFATTGDSILLIEDGVIATHSPLTLASFVAKCAASEISLYVLSDDILLRGIDNKYPLINSVDYFGFVDLITKHDKHLAW